MFWAISADKASPVRPLRETPGSLLYGYSVYTTFRWPLPQCWLDAHLQRLKNDAQTIGLQWPYEWKALQAVLTACYQPQHPLMRLTAFADVSGYGDFYVPAYAETLPVQLVLSCRALPSTSLPQKLLQRLTLHSVSHQKSLATVKLGGMADVILLKRQARLAGWDEVLLINHAGAISEASTANFFALRGETLYTPEPERDHCLPGITRRQVLEIAQVKGWTVQTAPLPLNALETMDGAFLTNAAQGIVSVAQVDQRVFPWPSEARDRVQALTQALEALNRRL